ncbi:hypothetical protein ANN_08231 [Periplaneta americana]|uniref:Uncharacterized protein n=1 Tax=Periplaneta americana TaxID=6978 RepID=A0ABQ8T0U4_PERAM|nr:hypothetical protein ANN_08231 [Periplaneta americana]
MKSATFRLGVQHLNRDATPRPSLYSYLAFLPIDVMSCYCSFSISNNSNKCEANSGVIFYNSRFQVAYRPKYFPKHLILKHPEPMFLSQSESPSFTTIQKNRLEHIKTLEKIKKRALKCCRKNSPLKWDTLTDRRTRIRLCTLFKTYREIRYELGKKLRLHFAYENMLQIIELFRITFQHEVRKSKAYHYYCFEEAVLRILKVVVITEDVQNVHLLLEYRPHIDDLRTRSQTPGVLRMSSEHATIRFRRDSKSGTGDE